MPAMVPAKLMQQAAQCFNAGQHGKAEQLCRQILVTHPGHQDAICMLGIISLRRGQPAAALVFLKTALSLNPNYPLAHFNLASAYLSLGQTERAIAAFQQTLAMKPDHAEALTYLGLALMIKGSLDEALAVLERAVKLQPSLLEAHGHLAEVLHKKQRLDEALAAYRHGISIAERDAPGRPPPLLADVHNRMANVLKDMGRLEESLAAIRRALELRPDFSLARSNLVYTMHFLSNVDPQALYQEHRRWNELHALPLAGQIAAHGNERSPGRRLRIGYVSPDFRAHVVGRFMLPLLAHHDHSQFEIFSYANVLRPDLLTQELRSHSDAWRDTVAMPDDKLAELIRQDQIDILVDLTMHMDKSRLPVFARKPAPVQVTYLAYVSTTGLDAMDYRLSDPYLDPEGSDLSLYSEETMRLPRTYWCYQPLPDMPAVSASPAQEKGYITFGCLNNFCKVNDTVLATWVEILQAVPTARLVFTCPEGDHVARVRATFANAGVGPERVDLIPRVTLKDYFSLYQRIDIALDPFPYTGGTTTCDAFWMGVPMITLAGSSAIARAGVSILRNLGTNTWIAESRARYVQLATALAKDLPRLIELRQTLRQQMQASPLMDAPRFARDIESAFRTMWHTWCSAPSDAAAASR